MTATAGALLVGVPGALLSAASFGSSAVLQYRATHEVPEREPGRPRLLLDLVRHPWWRWSIGLAAFGFALQVVALRFAPLILVQPLLVTGVLWYVGLSAVLSRRAADPMILCGTLLCLAGLSAFLVIASPSQHAGSAGLDSLRTVLPLASGLGVLVGACLVVAGTLGRRWRSLPLSLAAGVCYGVTAGLVRSVSVHFPAGPGAVFEHWQTCAILLLGPFGVLLNQNSYQAGRIGAPALAIITVTDPLVSIGVGLLWLDERILADPWRIAAEVVALLALAAGVLLIAMRAPHVRPAPVHRRVDDGPAGSCPVDGCQVDGGAADARPAGP